MVSIVAADVVLPSPANTAAAALLSADSLPEGLMLQFKKMQNKSTVVYFGVK